MADTVTHWLAAYRQKYQESQPSKSDLLLLFRFGFICHPTSREPLGDNTWRAIDQVWARTNVGDLTIRSHPETPIAIHHHNDSSVVQIGHAFPSGSALGQSLSESIAAATTEEEMLDTLDRFSGRFALLVSSNGGLRVFHDPIGARSVYYLTGKVTAVASHANLLGHAFRVRRRRDMAKYVASDDFQSRRPKYLPGDDTLFRRIRALIPNHYYDFKSGKCIRYWPRRSRFETTFEDFFCLIDEHFRGLADFLGSDWDPVVGITGGIDSRTAIAALRKYGIRLRGVTWLSHNWKERERPIVEELVGYLGIRHDYVIRSDAQALARICQRNAGEFRSIRNIQSYLPGMSGLYDGLNPVFIRGSGGEICRGGLYRHSEGAEQMRLIAAREMSHMYRYRRKKKLSDDTKFVKSTDAAFEGFLDRYDYTQLSDMDYAPIDAFYWEHRMGSRAGMVHNEMDPVIYGFAGFNSRRLFEATYGLPAETRLTKNLFLEVIRRYDCRLAKIPYV